MDFNFALKNMTQESLVADTDFNSHAEIRKMKESDWHIKHVYWCLLLSSKGSRQCTKCHLERNIPQPTMHSYLRRTEKTETFPCQWGLQIVVFPWWWIVCYKLSPVCSSEVVLSNLHDCCQICQNGFASTNTCCLREGNCRYSTLKHEGKLKIISCLWM